jgi:predicted nucleic acid-binding protein
MFIALALASNVKLIISGDKDLHDISGYKEIEVIKPRAFVEGYLN